MIGPTDDPNQAEGVGDSAPRPDEATLPGDPDETGDGLPPRVELGDGQDIAFTFG
jgi:hypothetical protein